MAYGNKPPITATTGTIFIRCGNCKEQYDLVRAKRKAEQLRIRNITCPNCGDKVATLN